MAEKEVLTTVKVQLWGGNASPAPPLGPALAPHGVNVGQFCRQFNNETQDRMGQKLPVVIRVYKDKSFSFIAKQPTVADLLKEFAEVRRGSGQPNVEKVGSITENELYRIAEIKMPDLNTQDLEAAASMIRGTAQSMGIEIRR